MSVRTGAGDTSFRECDRPPERTSGLRPVFSDEHLRTSWRHAGVVPPQVASVELDFAAKSGRGPAQTIAAPTSDGDAYRGRFAGRVRFFLTDGPPWSPWLRRYRGADGVIVGADESDSDQPLLAAATLAATRDRGSRWRLRATAHPELAPLPADRARLGREICFTLARGSAAPTNESCLKNETALALDLFVQPSVTCTTVRLLAMTSPRVRSVYAVLGDGRRARVDLRALPPGLGFAGRAGALVVRTGTAVRRMVALDESGGVVKTARLGIPPVTAACGPDTVFAPGFPGIDELFDVTGPLRVTAHDDGPRLCLALGDLVPLRDCALPPVGEDDSVIHVRRSGGETHVLGAVPADVATVELRPAQAGGRRFTVPTQAELPGYDGQYRGQVRFVSATFPGAPDVAMARHRSATGSLLEHGPTTAIYQYLAPPVPLPRSRPPVEVASTPGPGRTCIVAPDVGIVSLGPVRCAPVFDTAITVIVSCAPRRTSVYLSGRARRATVRLSGGRRARARILRVSSGPLAGRRVQAITVGARARIRTVTAGRRARLALPPAARQCGYSTAVSLDRR